MTTPTITTVWISDLILDDAIQPRLRLNQGKIAEYSALYKEGVKLSPIAVFEDEGVLRVADGFHCVHAAYNAGLEEISAEVRQGTRRDALLYACAANGTNALPLTADDKRQVVTRLLQDPEWGEWSDNAIAKHCHFAQSFVSKVRSSLNSEISETQPRTYTTRHGTTATMQTGRIGRNSQTPAPTETDAGEAPEAPAEAEAAATPEVLADGSSVLVHASTPLANGSTPHRRVSELTGQAPTPLDPGSSQPVDQHVPIWDLDTIVQESVNNLGEIGSQLDILAEDYRAFTDEGGQPFASAWAFATAPLPYGRGCDLDALLQSAAPLVTLLEILQAQAEPQEDAATVPPVEQVTNRQQVLAIVPTLKAPITAPKVVAATGLPIKVARRALEGLVKVKALVKVAGKPGEYRFPRKR